MLAFLNMQTFRVTNFVLFWFCYETRTRIMLVMPVLAITTIVFITIWSLYHLETKANFAIVCSFSCLLSPFSSIAWYWVGFVTV